MQLTTEPYRLQSARWPLSGRHILAQHDQDAIIVYQAYAPEIGRYALDNGAFGGAFSYARMSWIKPNFLWMMYRSGWGSKPEQEMVLGIKLRRTFFELLLAKAVASSFEQSHFATSELWKVALRDSDVRLQWDPDHAPDGKAIPRRALQLGLRGEALAAYGNSEIIEIIDMTSFVATQRDILQREGTSKLLLPRETHYQPADPSITKRLNLD